MLQLKQQGERETIGYLPDADYSQDKARVYEHMVHAARLDQNYPAAFRYRLSFSVDTCLSINLPSELLTASDVHRDLYVAKSGASAWSFIT